jgi:hypothetical protein
MTVSRFLRIFVFPSLFSFLGIGENVIFLPGCPGIYRSIHRAEMCSFSIFSERMSQVTSTGIEMLKTPYHAPRANAICERFLGSMRRECLDHVLILHEKQLHRVLNAYAQYFNHARPHQGIRQQIPEQRAESVSQDHNGGKILSFPILGGLHHEYRRSAVLSDRKV